MKNQSLALEPILAPEEKLQTQPEPQWVQEEEKLRNERSRWEEQQAQERLLRMFPASDFRKLVL
jgi:hypothetical protein